MLVRVLHMESPQVEQERTGLEKSPGEKVSTELVCVSNVERSSVWLLDGRMWQRHNRKSKLQRPIMMPTNFCRHVGPHWFCSLVLGLFLMHFSIPPSFFTCINNPVFHPLGLPSGEKSTLGHLFLLSLFPASPSNLPVYSRIWPSLNFLSPFTILYQKSFTYLLDVDWESPLCQEHHASLNHKQHDSYSFMRSLQGLRHHTSEVKQV